MAQNARKAYLVRAMSTMSTMSRTGGAPEADARVFERWVNGLIGAGHFMSHYYLLALPPLFPLLKAEFGVSYVELGLAMTCYNLLGGVLQAPVGFLVDRLGPRRVLFAGLALNAIGVLLMGFADAYWLLLVLAVIAGLGNSVFHPADYAILSGSIDPDRLGKAYSAHTFAGFLGGACAPIGILAVVQFYDWRTALISAGIVGLVVLALMILKRDVLLGEGTAADATKPAAAAEPAASETSGLRLILSAPVLLFLAYFVLYGMAGGGLTAFTVSSLINLHDIGLDSANGALTGYLFGIVGGILAGGLVADKFPRHMVTSTVGLGLVALFAAAPTFMAPPAYVITVMLAAAGFGMGVILPARDLMIRKIVPPGDSGKIFGFIFVGYSIGGSLAPLLYGWLLDLAQPAMVFQVSAGFAILALAAVALASLVSPKSFGEAATKPR